MQFSSLHSITPSARYTNISADALIKTGPGIVYAIVVNSHTNGAIILEDALTATTPLILNTYTYATGSQVIPLGIRFITGLYADITGTQDITILWN